MKEKEFEKKLNELHFEKGMIIPVYWTLDDYDEVLIDFDSMKEEFEENMKELEEFLKNEDKLQKIVKEKIEKINEEKKNE